MNAIQVLVFLPLVCSCLGQESCGLLPQLPEGMSTSGSEVVNKVLYQLECSGVFEDDHSFMRRLAYVETKDGTEGQGTTGIWNISEELLKQMNDSIREYNELTDDICKQFNINMSMAVNEPQTLTNPLVSGVVARFYLHYVTVTKDQQIPPAEDISGQAIFWGTHFRMSADAAMINHFTSRVLELKG